MTITAPLRSRGKMASSFEVTDRGHSKVLLHELNEQRIQGIFCDVTIVVQDSKFKAHKNILAAFSRYFKELLANQSLWVMDPVLELREMKAEIFAKILNFIYSSRVVIERLEEANDLASAGHRLGIHLLKDLLEVSSQTRACNDRLTPPLHSLLSLNCLTSLRSLKAQRGQSGLYRRREFRG
ncbi:zinc finger and BTB domain-containing protein 38-like [Carcharodon carcharias]|uniref:zinc finger and BTB domain-containing protein 38-like n=1 Tax=Carcharodon carcharias TaxID=13397 RepID=UPI001B7F416A|nr:zinc finger and BTB domain-containing protein 38-like [Carcharodon carcharias]